MFNVNISKVSLQLYQRLNGEVFVYYFKNMPFCSFMLALVNNIIKKILCNFSTLMKIRYSNSTLTERHSFFFLLNYLG